MEDKTLTDNITYENRLNVPESEKKNGDEYLQSNNLEEAIRCYSKAIMAVKILYDDKAIDSEQLKKMVKEIGIPSNLNISYCYLKLKEWQKVVDHTTRVIEFDSRHVKALYRRCLAYINLQKFEKADLDLVVLEDSIGGSKELEELENLFEKKQEEIKENQSLIYKKMFKKYVDGIN
jgi:tetratricopeptide (TPR) repeat protein